MKTKNYKIFLFIGLAILVFFSLWALFPQIFRTHDIKESFTPFLPPSSQHLLGTNDLGYDIYSELVTATATTLTIGVVSALASIIVGGIIGLISGFFKGLVGELFNMLINIFLLIPMLPLVIVISTFFGSKISHTILIISLLGWCGTARVIRAQTKGIKQMNFVEALIILGISKKDIILKHILPNIMEIISAQFILSVGRSMLVEASVSFMGLGDPNQLTWGSMINIAFKRGGFAGNYLNWYLVPGICISLCILAFYFLSIYLDNRQSITPTGYLE